MEMTREKGIGNLETQPFVEWVDCYEESRNAEKCYVPDGTHTARYYEECYNSNRCTGIIDNSWIQIACELYGNMCTLNE